MELFPLGHLGAGLLRCSETLPAVAVSLDLFDATDPNDFKPAAQVAAKVVSRVLEKGLPPLTILNLNVPNRQEIKGIRLTRQGVRIYLDELARDGDIYRIVGPAPGGIMTEEGTDLWAVHNGYASLTPLHLDLTAHQFMAELAAWDLNA